MKIRLIFIVSVILLSTASIFAQSKDTKNDTTTELQKNYALVSKLIAKAADLVPSEKYSYKPTDSTRTFGQLVAHVADSYNYYCTAATGKKIEWSDAVEKGALDKQTLVQKIKQGEDSCNAIYGKSGPVSIMMENISHLNLHYGNIITYLRLMGLTPPSS